MLWVRTSSFCGGTGGSSAWGTGALSPSGPRGPRESSRACSRTGWVPGLLGVRGLRPAGDLRGWEEDGSREVVDFGLDDSAACIRQFSDWKMVVLPSAENPLPSGAVDVVALEGTSTNSRCQLLFPALMVRLQ